MSITITKSQLKEMIQEAILKEQSNEKSTDYMSLEKVESYLKIAAKRVQEGKRGLEYWAGEQKSKEIYRRSLDQARIELEHALNLIDNINGKHS